MSWIVTEFLERLDLEEAIVCFNDWGGAQTMVASGGVERVGGLVLLSLMRGWLEPLKRREIRRVLRRYVTDVRHGRRLMREATPALRSFERPAGRLGRRGEDDAQRRGRRLAKSLPTSGYIELPACYTLIPLDQPQALAREIGKFAG